MTAELEQPNLDQVESALLQHERQGLTSDEDVAAVIQLTNLLSSRDLGDYPRQTALLHRAAALALTSAHPLTLEQQLHLLAHLEVDVPPKAEGVAAAWRDRRQERAEQWLAALRRLEDAIDPAFDPTNVPALNVWAPGGLPAGIAPQHIKDPALRREYEANLERNAQKAEHYASQWRARQLREAYEPHAIRYLGRAYGPHPEDWAELEGLINAHGMSARTRNAILQGVQRHAGESGS